VPVGNEFLIRNVNLGSELPRFASQVTHIDGFHGGQNDGASLYDEFSSEEDESDIGHDSYDDSADNNSHESDSPDTE
jgi:hypothetical protein